MPLKDFTQQEIQDLTIESISLTELARRLNYKSHGAILETIKTYLIKNDIDFSHFTGLARGRINRTPDNVFVENSNANQTVLRRMYLKENIQYQCVICGQLPLWKGQSLTLVLDHINGNNHDDRLENLRWVCPNCNAQLDTFCRKNK